MLLPWGVSVFRRLPRDRVRVVERTGSGPRRSEAMNQSRHWTAWMATLLILLGLAILPREGAAWARYTDPIEPILFGDPDQPNHYGSARTTTERVSTAPGTYLPVVTF